MGGRALFFGDGRARWEEAVAAWEETREAPERPPEKWGDVGSRGGTAGWEMKVHASARESSAQEWAQQISGAR